MISHIVYSVYRKYVVLLAVFDKDDMLICQERGTKKNSESRTGIEPMASQMLVGALRETLGDLGHLLGS